MFLWTLFLQIQRFSFAMHNEVITVRYCNSISQESLQHDLLIQLFEFLASSSRYSDTCQRNPFNAFRYYSTFCLSNGRASNYVEFLTAGDLDGTLKKSVKELEKRFRGTLEFCHEMAAHHSKQLFQIYETYEDPLWSKRIL